MIIGCASTPAKIAETEQALARLLASIETAGVLAAADSGSARITINLCGT